MPVSIRSLSTALHFEFTDAFDLFYFEVAPRLSILSVIIATQNGEQGI